MKRSFVSDDFQVTNWESLQPLFEELYERKIPNQEAFLKWFKDWSELESVISEDAGWRYIHMTCDTGNKEKVDHYTYFVQNIQPKISPWEDKLNRKAIEFEDFKKLNRSGYPIVRRSITKNIEIFREKNIELFTRAQEEAQKYQAITGAMSIDHEGKELTLQQAAALLQENDRSLRETVYRKVNERRLKDADELDNLFSTLVSIRQEIAQNADFNNYRDYMFASLGRFDYTPEDCFEFHKSIAKETMPLVENIVAKRKEELGYDNLRPWDLAVDTQGRAPLKPFYDGNDLLSKSIACFDQIDSFFGDCLRKMRDKKHLDLESRKGKAPGGYNYPLYESGLPFIFMNAAGTLRDMVTLMHEGGHAVHSVLTEKLELVHFKSTPSEIAELASMSMELISMEFWDTFFKEEDELRRAKRDHLEQVLETLPWVAVIDKFQHTIYENPEHQPEERTAWWLEIFDTYTPELIDYNGLESYKARMWQKQLHLFEVPFYYIEYAMAQLGAIAVWRNYRNNPEKALQQLKDALQLGYTKTIPETYEVAGIQFDFSGEYIRELMQFVSRELARQD